MLVNIAALIHEVKNQVRSREDSHTITNNDLQQLVVLTPVISPCWEDHSVLNPTDPPSDLYRPSVVAISLLRIPHKSPEFPSPTRLWVSSKSCAQILLLESADTPEQMHTSDVGLGDIKPETRVKS